MCIVFATVAELIETVTKFDDKRRIKLTMLDFFTEDEIEHFLKNFTAQGYPVSYSARSPDWLKTNVNWPRKMTESIDLREASIRYDIKNKDIYRQDVWNGLYTVDMFKPIASSENRFPSDFDELLDSPFGAIDDSIIEIEMNDTVAPNFSEVENASESSDDSESLNTLDSKWERWSERNMKDPTWRRDAKEFYSRLIKTTRRFNARYKG